ncbi:MAG: NAD kinase [Streptococcaceae bacterium]|jgi:NAD+ kinase|nr:NAD kinase [Streptococcaceae bacterium]
MKMSERIAVVGNSTSESQKIVKQLSEMLSVAGYQLTEQAPELVITVGGDGTLLKGMHLYETQLDAVRFVGVHTGHLGFYTDFTNDQLSELLSALPNENPEKATRYPLLKVTVTCHDGRVTEHLALNESIIRTRVKTLVADVSISGEFFERFRGDGLSVATPSGSTAYNKSVGGAVMHPAVAAMQMAEVASLNNIVFRTLGAPIIIAKKDTLTIVPASGNDYVLTIDQFALDFSDIAEIRYEMSGETIAFANLNRSHFWKRVRHAFIEGNN